MCDILKAKKIFIYPGYTSMSYGINGLIRKIVHPEVNCAYVFCNKAKDNLKILLFQDNYAWLCQKRIFRGKFIWPNEGDKTMVDDTILQYLVDGIDTINRIELKNEEIEYTFF